MENPATNGTIPGNPTYLWMGEPKQRGTFGIVAICISTLVICVWSTIHFNVPSTRLTLTRGFFTQVLWMVIALLAPEYLLYLAINQWTDVAYLVRKTLQSHPRLSKGGIYDLIRGPVQPKDEHHDPSPTDPCPTFGFVHAFYAIMGGFAFLSERIDKPSTVDESLYTLPVHIGADYKVPSFHGVMYIMKHFPHLITNIPEETILGLAQSNSISKALLIVQVGWFCANCASRLIQHLPLSLLEVSTAAHALCTLLTYVVWWSKPLNIPEPIILRGKEAREVYALLRCSRGEYKEALEMAWEMAQEKAPEKAPGMAPASGDSSTLIGGDPANIIPAANALLGILQMGRTPEEPPPDHAVGGIVHAFPGSFENNFHKGPLVEWTVTTVSPILYGLIHLLAWSDHFPTPLERRLWRVSSVVITSSGLTGVLLILVGEFLLGGFKRAYDRRRPQDLLLISTVSLIPALHVLASGFLLIESFRQLFFLDPAAYQVPSWSNFWPHLS